MGRSTFDDHDFCLINFWLINPLHCFVVLYFWKLCFLVNNFSEIFICTPFLECNFEELLMPCFLSFKKFLSLVFLFDYCGFSLAFSLGNRMRKSYDF